MTDAQFPDVLEYAAVEVLEKMFFVAAVATDEQPGEALAVEVEFQGEPSGRFTLRVAPRAAAAIAANFLGEDPSSLTERQVAEVSCELANMICGDVLSRLEGTATFRLLPPRLVPAELRPGAPAVSLDTGDGLLSMLMETGCPV